MALDPNPQEKSDALAPQPPVVAPGYTYTSVTEKISAIVLTRPTSNGWFLGFGIGFLLTMVLLFAILPFGVQSQHELDDIVPGTEPGAPARPRLLIKLTANTIIAALLWAIFDYFYIVYLVPH